MRQHLAGSPAALRRPAGFARGPPVVAGASGHLSKPTDPVTRLKLQESQRASKNNALPTGAPVPQEVSPAWIRSRSRKPSRPACFYGNHVPAASDPFKTPLGLQLPAQIQRPARGIRSPTAAHWSNCWARWIPGPDPERDYPDAIVVVGSGCRRLAAAASRCVTNSGMCFSIRSAGPDMFSAAMILPEKSRTGVPMPMISGSKIRLASVYWRCRDNLIPS